MRKFPGAPGDPPAAREGRSSGVLEAPEVPGDGSDGEFFKFLDFAHVAVFELEIAFWEPWGAPRGVWAHPGQFWATSIFDEIFAFSNFVRT